MYVPYTLSLWEWGWDLQREDATIATVSVLWLWLRFEVSCVLLCCCAVLCCICWTGAVHGSAETRLEKMEIERYRDTDTAIRMADRW